MHSVTGFFAQFHRLDQVSDEPCFHLEPGFLFKVHSGCWQNLVLGDYRTELPTFFLAVDWGSLSTPRGCLQVLAM